MSIFYVLLSVTLLFVKAEFQTEINTKNVDTDDIDYTGSLDGITGMTTADNEQLNNDLKTIDKNRIESIEGAPAIINVILVVMSLLYILFITLAIVHGTF